MFRDEPTRPFRLAVASRTDGEIEASIGLRGRLDRGETDLGFYGAAVLDGYGSALQTGCG
jgi:hypothetical protein